MADHTSHYNLTKPVYGETVDVQDINGNMDTLDAIIYDADQHAQSRVSNAYDDTQSYAVGDFCIHENELYKCITATTGTWDSTAWALTNIAEAFEPKHTWSLLETITADGSAKRYDRTLTEPISGLFIIFSVTTATASDNIQVYAWFKNESGAKRAGYVLGGLNTAARYSHVRYTQDGNMWVSEQSSAVSGNSVGTTLGRNANGYHFTTEEMEKFRIDTDSLNFPTGSTITIYVRQ